MPDTIAVILPLVVIGLAFLAAMQGARRLRNYAVRRGGGQRITGYWLIAARSLLTAAFALGLLWWIDRHFGARDFASALAGIGLHARLSLDETLSLGVAMAAVAYIVSVAVTLLRRRRKQKVTARLAGMFPQSPGETAVFFLVLSPAVGIGEEIVYRGVLQWAIATLTDDPVSAIGTTAVLFGMLHLYQGGLGILRTAFIGLIFGAGTWASGSLIPAILAHTLLDMTSTLVRVPAPAPARAA